MRNSFEKLIRVVQITGKENGQGERTAGKIRVLTREKPTVQVKGAPTEETLEQCYVLGKNLAEAIKS